jgi:hypothetical protein
MSCWFFISRTAAASANPRSEITAPSGTATNRTTKAATSVRNSATDRFEVATPT